MTNQIDQLPDWPLSNEDGDWIALDGSWSRYEAASELAHNLVDYWLDGYRTWDDEDKCHGWVTGYRALLSRLRRGFVRPYDEVKDECGEPGWWMPCESNHPLAVASWEWEQ